MIADSTRYFAVQSALPECGSADPPLAATPLRHHFGLLWILSRPDLYESVLPDAEEPGRVAALPRPAPASRRQHGRRPGASLMR